MNIEYHYPKYDKEVVLDNKSFFLGMRNTEIAIPYIVLNDNISPKLFSYVTSLNAVKFVDGSFHTYYGEIKQIIDKLINYWMEEINDAIREADRIKYSVTKTELLRLINKSYQIHERRHIDFAHEFLPAHTPEQQKEFDKIFEKFKHFMEEFRHIRDVVDTLDKPQTLIDFANKHIEISMHRRTALLEYTHGYISDTLAHHTNRIRCSLEECLLRVKSDLKKMEADRDITLNKLLIELYDKNKERLSENRKENRCFYKQADTEFNLYKLRLKIEECHKFVPVSRLKNEIRYWEQRICEYDTIESVLKKVKLVKATILEQQKRYNSLRCIDIDPSKQECFAHIGKTIQQRKAYIEEKLTDVAKALVTFFGVRGQNRIFYTDRIGKYSLDEYGHQIYFFDSGERVSHVDCYGNFREVCEGDKYYYDKNGRYIQTASGQKLYQTAPCTSSYNLGNDALLENKTVDCGHSDNIRPYCRMQLNDPNDRAILPSFEKVDIKDSLKPETVQYLWKNVVHILPEPLHDVEKLRTKNPIHDLAHSIIFHRYRRTPKEMNESEQETNKFRVNVLEGRKNKIIAQCKAWKGKQTQRHKPAESADMFNRAIYDAHLERLAYIRSLNFFNDN